MAQWTIDPRDVTDGKVSADVCAKALAVVDARVVVPTDNPHVFLCPSYTDTTQASREEVDVWVERYRYQRALEPPHGWYKGFLVYDPRGWKYSDNCPSETHCHHGYAVALEVERRTGVKIPVPGEVKEKPKRGRRSRSLTVIPGGKT